MLSCRRENPILPNPPSNDTIVAETFPNQIGDRWTYSVFDSIHKTNQTVVVKIVGDTIFKNGEKFKIWVYNYPYKTDTGYVNIVGDTVRLNTKYGILNTMYLFPLYKDKSWLSGLGMNLTTKVEKIEIITVPAGIFNNCYDIQTVIASYNYVLIQDNWFEPKVGIIQKHIYENNLGHSRREMWKLASYKLTN